MPFALDTLPECFEKEPNNDPAHAQKVKLPIIINGRIDRPDDWDVFQFTGRAGETIVAEVSARRLDSPLDSVLKLTDATGKLLAFNDDYEDPEAGLNTHHADSYLMVKLPADGTYYVHLGDTARNGGEEYAYRLRISAAAARFRAVRRAVQHFGAQQGQRRRQRPCHPQRRVHRPHQAGLERSAGGILVAARYRCRRTQTTARLTVKTNLGGDEAARQARRSKAARRSADGKSSTRPCRRKTGCRPSCGGIWCRRRKCSAWCIRHPSSRGPGMSCTALSYRRQSRNPKLLPVIRRLRSSSSPRSRLPIMCGRSSSFSKKGF